MTSKKEIRIPDASDIESGGLKGMLVNSMPFFVKITGIMVRTVGRVFPGTYAMKLMGKASARIITSYEIFGVKKAEDPADVVSEWLKMLTAVKARLEIGEAGDNEVEVFLLECPLGLTPKHGRNTCLTAMATDVETVKCLGGKLVIGETIATGAEKCHLKVVRV